MGEFIGLCIILIAVLSPLLRRLYIERFWIHGRGTVIHLDGGISNIPSAVGTWVWAPIIEYYVGARRFSSKVSYLQRFNAKSKYTVGDEVDILYDPRNPSRVMLDSWAGHIIFTIFIGGVVVERILHSK